MKTLIKYVDKANMWVHTSVSFDTKSKTKTIQKWFDSEEEAKKYHEEQERKNNKENDDKVSSK